MNWAVPDEGIYSLGLDAVQCLHSGFNLTLIGLNINNEHKGVVIFNLLHGRLGGQGELEDLVVIHLSSAGGRLVDNLGVSSQLQSLGFIEVHLGVDTGSLAAAALL